MLIYLIYSLTFIKYTCNGEMDILTFNENDILNEKFMPISIFLQQENNLKGPISNKTLTTYTDINHALFTMNYHRKMMNEYLCGSYLAKQILDEITPSLSNFTRKAGVASNFRGNNTRALDVAKNTPEELIRYDTGSSLYQNWLSKRATFDDIQKLISTNKTNITTESLTTSSSSNLFGKPTRQQEYNGRAGLETDYVEGDITGYAIHQPLEEYNQRPDIRDAIYPTAGNKNGFFNLGHEESKSEYGLHQSEKSKEVAIRDIMDIVLTTLAFLAFGLFILQVIMCITMHPSQNNLRMMSMENKGSSEIFRTKRSVIGKPSIQLLDEISKHVLVSMEALLLSYKSEEDCLRLALCQNNRFAKSQKNNWSIWLPVWGLGISWLSAKIKESKLSSAMIFGNLRASIFGLGGIDCKKAFPNCSMITKPI